MDIPEIQMTGSEISCNVGEPEFVRPSIPTPTEFKYLSNIDDQLGLRNHISFLHVYRRPASGCGRDPGAVVRCALSRALVHYYPLAGRLRHGDKGKLVVDCNREGVVYGVADADVSIGRLREINGALRPPFRHLDQFLVDDVWGCNMVTDSPLLRVQVTRHVCGGFILAYTLNHCLCDAFSTHQFISTVAEFARDPALLKPSIAPTWPRDVLAPRTPPKISYPHPKYDVIDPESPLPPTEGDFRSLAQTSVFFSREDVACLKLQIAVGSTFNAVASCLWQARARVLAGTGPARLLFAVDTRSRHLPLLPKSYYV